MASAENRYQTFRVRPATNGDAGAVRALVFSVLAEYGLAADPDGTDADLRDIEAVYHEPGGSFEVVEDAHGRMVGTVGLYRTSATSFELRKMYLSPAARGRGLGRWLLARSLEHARKAGAQRVTLETAAVLAEAIALYQSFGFRAVPGAHCSARCDQAYELDLTGMG
jgi:putative acetyltransferase